MKKPADEMLVAGDVDGQATWKRILKAVEELLAKELSTDATVH